MEFELENPLTSFKEHQPDTIPALFADESDHMPSSHYSSKASHFHISLRREAISLILQAQFSRNFDPCIPYLAINYIDRFISKQEIPRQGNSWIVRLIVISCLSLAAKMKDTDLSLSDLQRNEVGFIFDPQSIRRMELLILTTLNWRMRSITPFSFLYYFLSFFDLQDPKLIQALKHRASDIIFKSHYEIKLLEYKPSIIAATALLSASKELFPLQFPCLKAAISSCQYVSKVKLWNCLIAMEEMMMERYESMIDEAGSNGPISILDHHCTTSESQNATTTSNTVIKRRKISGFYGDHAVHISQIQQC